MGMESLLDSFGSQFGRGLFQGESLRELKYRHFCTLPADRIELPRTHRHTVLCASQLPDSGLLSGDTRLGARMLVTRTDTIYW